MRKLSKQVPVLGIVMFFLNSPVFATTGTTGLPWEAPLQTLQNSISGPVAVLIAIIALAAIGVTLIFGGEWNEFARRGVFAVCAIALLVGGAVIMTTLFNVSSACV
jgi:type IV secretion system protein TrbC